MEDIEISEDEVALVEEIRGDSKKRVSLNQKKLSKQDMEEFLGL
ncbi:MAG: hypothetical protein AABX70_01810 [Nanoarchaeota archaeon]